VQRPVQEGDAAHRDALGAQVHDELAEALMAFAVAGAAQHDAPVVAVRSGGPDLGAVQQPSAVGAARPRPDRRPVAAGVGLARPNGEGALAAADAGQEALLLLLGAE